MGLPMYATVHDAENPIQFDLWDKSYDSCRSRRTLSTVTNTDLDLNKESLLVDLDLINELKDKSRIREKACKMRAARRCNSKVKPRNFQKGDLVWRMSSDARKDDGKFSSNWEGLFRIANTTAGGAYFLEFLSGKHVPRTWNARHLKFYYSW